MAYFAVRCVLRNESEVARRRFCDEAERLGGLEAVDGLYLLDLDGTATEVGDHFQRYLGSRDRLLVIEFANGPVVQHGLSGTDEWLSERFGAAARTPEVAA